MLYYNINIVSELSMSRTQGQNQRKGILMPTQKRSTFPKASTTCAWLAVLRWYALRNGLQRSGRRCIFKMHGNIGFKQVLERSDGVFGFFKTKFYFEQKKVDQKLATGHAEQLSGKIVA
jgi:hypothetical protein